MKDDSQMTKEQLEDLSEDSLHEDPEISILKVDATKKYMTAKYMEDRVGELHSKMNILVERERNSELESENEIESSALNGKSILEGNKQLVYDMPVARRDSSLGKEEKAIKKPSPDYGKDSQAFSTQTNINLKILIRDLWKIRVIIIQINKK